MGNGCSTCTSQDETNQFNIHPVTALREIPKQREMQRSGNYLSRNHNKSIILKKEGDGSVEPP